MLPALVALLLPLSLAPVAAQYAPKPAKCPSGPIVRAASGISDAEASYTTARKAKADAALAAWVRDALGPDASTASLPTIALATSGGGFRSFLTGAGVVQGLDGRERSSSAAKKPSVAGLYQAATYHAGLSGGAWLVSALAGADWPTVTQLRDSVWAERLAGGILDASSAATVADYAQIAQEIAAKGAAGFPVSLTDPWGRMVGYQTMAAGEGGVNLTLSGLAALGNFTQFNAPFPLLTASKITRGRGVCEPTASEALFEFNPFEFGSWSDDVSAFVQAAYLGSTVAGGQADACVTGGDSLNFAAGVSSNILFEFTCNASLGVNITSRFPDAILGVVAKYTSTRDWGYSLVRNPFRGYTSQTARASSPVANLSDLLLVDGGVPDRGNPVLPLLEPSRNVSVIIVNDNSDDDASAWPDGTSVASLYAATQDTRLHGRFPRVPAAGAYSNKTAQFFGCDEPAAVTVVYLPNAHWSYAANTPTLKLQYAPDETRAMIRNGHDVATQGGDDEWVPCLACGVMLKEFGADNLSADCAACLAHYCWYADLH